MTADRRLVGDDPFVAARPHLVGVAYRLVGSVGDAEDVVQEAWLRWQRTDAAGIDNPAAWLTTVVTRLALDHLRRRSREQGEYVGPWLPTPVVAIEDPATNAELAESMTTAFLLLLERLTPDERAAFLLADVFGERFAAIAATLDRSEESCRQLASRARRKLRAAELRRRDDHRAARQLADRFAGAVIAGDEAAAIACVAPDAVLVSDGGARRRAARRPVRGPDRIVRFMINLVRRELAGMHVEVATVGGFPGFAAYRDGELELTVSIEAVDGRVVRVMTMLNPDKLREISHSSGTIE